ncbi:MAG: AI-2E family transporter [Bryobacteraceae bacterium]|nr:AI-2E family transporter [Bryobacteraceae bacterium]
MLPVEVKKRRGGLLLYAAALVIVIAGMRAANDILLPLLVSVLIAMVSAPAVRWLKGKGVPSAAAALLVVVAMLGVLSLVGFLVATSIRGFVQAAPGYRDRLNEQLAGLFGWLQNHGYEVHVRDLINTLDPGAVMGAAANVFSAIGGLIGRSVLIFLTVTFILLEVSSFAPKLHAAFGNAEATIKPLERIAASVQRYLELKTMLAAMLATWITVWVTIVGLDFPILWGFLAFLLDFIPNIGSPLAAIPAVALAFVQLGPLKMLIVALGYISANFVVSNLVEPRLMGRGLGLSPLVVFLSLLLWGWILGTAGMFLAVPLTVALRIALAASSSTRPFAILMGGKASLEALPPEPAPAEEAIPTPRA